jgi:hypothetical protein
VKVFAKKIALFVVVAQSSMAGMLLDSAPDDAPVFQKTIVPPQPASRKPGRTGTNTTLQIISISTKTFVQKPVQHIPNKKPEKPVITKKPKQTEIIVNKPAQAITQKKPAPPVIIEKKPLQVTRNKQEKQATVSTKVTARPHSDSITNMQPSPPQEALNHKFAMFISAGNADGSVQSMATGIDIYSSKTWFSDGEWVLTPYTELLLGSWKGDPGHTRTDSLVELGTSIYLRYIRKSTHPTLLRPYADLGLGLHYLTENKIEDKELGTQWLFGSNADIGILLGRTGKIDIGLRWRHLSNGGTKEPNWGINHIMGRMAIRF